MTKSLKKKINFLIFGEFKRKNPCAVGSNRRILGRNVIVRTHGIFYKAKTDLDLIGFTDSDWEGDNADRKSILGYVFILVKDQSDGQARSRVP